MVLITMHWQCAIMEHRWHNAGNNYRVYEDVLVAYGFWKLTFYVTWFYFESCTKDSFIEVKNFDFLNPKGSLAK
jgi:hypothetical protein